ncbi:MAG: prolyl oligopeptidase family serine peptidase [Clostridia bacterium]|nr:prolyl oligopeptidase family serine peptidase [Clostridia bacterium]
MTTSRFTRFDLSCGFNNLVYVPENRDPEKKLPLVIFLHGAGERGTDPELLSVHGPFKLIKNGWNPDFICVAPQCPEGAHWNDKTEMLKVFIDGVTEEFNADPERIYITGISMGGFGTWALLARWGSFFAAGVPICGGGMPWTAEAICTVPVWAFHGDSDSVVDVHYSRDMVKAVNSRLGSTPNAVEARLTEYPGVDHDSWTATYENEEMWAWMLEQKKK